MAISLRASKHGLLLVDRARRQKGWFKSQKEWLEAAEVAGASLRRFWLSEPIKRENFIKICEVIGIDWEEVADTSESVDSLPDAIERMKRLYTKVAELDPMLDEKTAQLDEETLKSLCYGWLHELFTLMLKATESLNPDKSFYLITREIIHKIGTLFESHDSQPEEAQGLFAKIVVKDEPGALHQVTGKFEDKEINISQLHIVQDGEGMATLKIYCQSSSEKPMDKTARDELETAIKGLTRVISAEVEKLAQEQP